MEEASTAKASEARPQVQILPDPMCEINVEIHRKKQYGVTGGESAAFITYTRESLMVDITHDWDETDTRAVIEAAFEKYKDACYGKQPLGIVQRREIKQAFLSGIHYLNGLDSYDPREVQIAIADILKDMGILK